MFRKRKEDPNSIADLEEWYAICDEPPQSPCINPVTPSSSDAEVEDNVDQAEPTESLSAPHHKQEDNSVQR
jgi:hypothetical protein